MDNNLQSVIAKVQKLVALSKNNSNMNEAEAAARLADQLIQEHRLSQAQIEANTGASESMEVLSVYKAGKRSSWRETLLSAICKHYGCSFYISGVVEYKAVGKESDVKIVEYMFAWLERTIVNVGKERNKGHGVGYGKSWMCGAASGVAATFKEMSSNQAVTGSAMVLLANRAKESDSYMKEVILRGNSRYAKGLVGGRSYNGLASGYSYGKSIQVNQGLNGSETKSHQLT